MILCFTLSWLVVSCGGVKQDYAFSDGKLRYFDDTIIQTGECYFDHDKRTSAILGIIATAAISTGISTLQKSLAEAAKADETADEVLRYANLNVGAQNFPNCFQVIRGRFTYVDRVTEQNINAFVPPPMPRWFARWNLSPDEMETEAIWKSWSTALARQGLALIASKPPGFVFEGTFVHAPGSGDNYALKVVPNFWAYEAPSRFTLWRSSARDVSIEIGLKAPKDELKTNAVLHLGTLRGGQSYRFHNNNEVLYQLQNCQPILVATSAIKTDLTALEDKKKAHAVDPKKPALTDHETARMKDLEAQLNSLSKTKPTVAECYNVIETRLDKESPWFLVTIPKTREARVLAVSTNEIKDEAPALAFVAATLGEAQKQGLSDQISKQVVPSLRAAEETTQDAARRKATQTFLNAKVTVATRLTACSKATGDAFTVAAIQAEAELNALSDAAFLADRNDPFSGGVSLHTPDDCNRALQALK